MTYRVEFLRIVEQWGALELEAESAEEALKAAKELAALPGKVVKQPTWDVPTTRTTPTRVTEVAA